MTPEVPNQPVEGYIEVSGNRLRYLDWVGGAMGLKPTSCTETVAEDQREIISATAISRQWKNPGNAHRPFAGFCGGSTQKKRAVFENRAFLFSSSSQAAV